MKRNRASSNLDGQIVANDSIRWLEILACLSGLIGICGLIALTAPNIWAADSSRASRTSKDAKRSPANDPRPGFESGNRAFNNPFATPPPAGGRPPGGSFFDDEEEVDFPDESDAPAYGNTGNPGNYGNQGSPGGFTGAPSQGNPSGSRGTGGKSSNGISMGGNNPVSSSIAPPKPLSVDTESGEGAKETVTDFNFPDADIMDIAKTLGKLTGKNFIYDKDVKGRISIVSNAPITVSDAWRAFLTALDMNGFALIPSGKYIRIARNRDARDKQLKTFTGDYSPDTDALITRLFPLKYLSAEEVARNFRSFMPANSRIIPYEQTNTVIVTDTGANISKLSKLLEILDVEGYEAGIEVIPVKFASAAELSKLIDTLIPGTGGGGAPGAPRFGGGGGGGRFSARRTKEGGIINTIIADERTNTLIVHANTRGADQVRELVAKLDQKLPAVTGGGKVHVVYLQFADAEQISNTLNSLSSGAGPRSAPAGPGGGTGVNPVQAALFEGNIKIAADKATNSLVVTASPGDFVTVQRVINKLDIPRDQVYAEVVIMEVSLGKDFTFSTNVVSPTSGIFLTPNTDLIDFIQSPISQRGAILSFASKNAKDYTIGGQTVKVANVQGLIKALQTNSNANILATPQIMTLDNTEATFETAERIPVPTSTAVNGAVAQSITKESVSLSITIKPQINKISNLVKLDIQTKLADINNRELPAQVRDLAIATIERNAKTSIYVADRDTVVLGGLMRDNQSEQISKIPLLGDIPVLGWLFKAKRTQNTKTNLLIFITPNIVRQYEKVRAILDKKLKERDDFLEASTGGEDPNRNYRDRLIRDLPDIKDITNAKPPEKYQTLDDETPAAVPVEPETSKEAAKDSKSEKKAETKTQANKKEALPATEPPATATPSTPTHGTPPEGTAIPPTSSIPSSEAPATEPPATELNVPETLDSNNEASVNPSNDGGP